MKHITEDEEAALIFASRVGGEYLEQIKVTDLVYLSHAQWMEFLKRVCLTFDKKKSEISSCPF